MKILETYKSKWKKKSWWSWLSDIVFALLIIGMLIPSTRTPLMVFIKKLTLFGPSVSANDQYGQLTTKDLTWKLQNTKGEIVDLGDFQDQPIFLNFWATWCPPCIAEMPSIERLEKEYGDQVHFILVSNENQNITQKFLKEKQLNLSTYQALEQEPELLRSNSIPITYIINKKGEIIAKESGSSKWDSDSVKKLLDQLIEE